MITSEKNRSSCLAIRRSCALFSPRTLRKWLHRFWHGGLSALGDAARKNLGSQNNVPQKLEKRLFELRGEHLRWTLVRILCQLISEKLGDMVNPSRSTS